MSHWSLPPGCGFLSWPVARHTLHWHWSWSKPLGLSCVFQCHSFFWTIFSLLVYRQSTWRPSFCLMDCTGSVAILLPLFMLLALTLNILCGITQPKLKFIVSSGCLPSESELDKILGSYSHVFAVEGNTYTKNCSLYAPPIFTW